MLKPRLPCFSLRLRISLLGLFLSVCLGLISPEPSAAVGTLAVSQSYTNPLSMNIPSGGRVGSCPDPTLIHGQQSGDNYWYMYCTSDPLNDADRNSTGTFNQHLLTIHKSFDLVNWTYVGDAFARRPAWVADNASLWAPDIEFFDGTYHLYYAATETNLAGGGSAIGVAISQSPTGPWIDPAVPVVEPQAAPCCPGSRRAVIDPEIVTDDAGQKYIYYGSYFGGISARKLSSDGLSSNPASQTQITIANRYEAADVVKHDGYYYLFVSATNCCHGPLSGYSVFAGRSTNPLGPFVDREGVSLLAGRVGGTPVISMNGNQWVGPGHNEVFTDFRGQDWLLYHAIDRNDPYFTGTTDFTKRPVLMDSLDWIDGWPIVRGGRWASDDSQPAPAAQPGDETLRDFARPAMDVPAALNASRSDEFDRVSLGPQWHWVRPPALGTYRLTGESFHFDTQPADLFEASNNAAVLLEPAPLDDFIVETRVKLNLPPEDCCHNYVQAGLVIYGDDDNYIKLTNVSIFETRQTEFAKEMTPPLSGYPRYGNTVIGPPDDWTYLRIVKRTLATEEYYTGYTSRDGVRWIRGGTWTHRLGENAQIGLVSMGGVGFFAEYDYVRVYGVSANLTGTNMQFSAANFQVGEGDGRAVIAVTRTGDLSGTASVNYRTTDTDTFAFGCADITNNHGGAYARCDFATTVGTLSFAAGESSKTFTVPIVDDGIVEGNELFQVTLSNAVGVTLVAPATATAIIVDNDTANAPNPIFASTFFVRQQYLDFLSREPEAEGLAAWLRVLNNCSDVNNNPACDRILVSQSFFGSAEFQLKGFYVFRFYRLAFNRLPEYAEIIPDMSFVAGSTAAEVYARKAQLAANFTQRQEFVTTYGSLSNADFVNTLLNRYRLTQVITPDPANPDGTQTITLTGADLINRLGAAGAQALTRAQVLRAVADSDQVGAMEYNDAFVAMQYYGYLRRKPEPAGYQAWLRVLRSGDVRTMVNGFMNSQEYRLRFGQL